VPIVQNDASEGASDPDMVNVLVAKFSTEIERLKGENEQLR